MFSLGICRSLFFTHWYFGVILDIILGSWDHYIWTSSSTLTLFFLNFCIAVIFKYTFLDIPNHMVWKWFYFQPKSAKYLYEHFSCFFSFLIYSLSLYMSSLFGFILPPTSTITVVFPYPIEIFIVNFLLTMNLNSCKLYKLVDWCFIFS